MQHVLNRHRIKTSINKRAVQAKVMKLRDARTGLGGGRFAATYCRTQLLHIWHPEREKPKVMYVCNTDIPCSQLGTNHCSLKFFCLFEKNLILK